MQLCPSRGQHHRKESIVGLKFSKSTLEEVGFLCCFCKLCVITSGVALAEFFERRGGRVVKGSRL